MVTRRLLIVLFLVLFAAACSIVNPDPRVNPLAEMPTPSRERVEGFIGAALPASASDVYTAEGGFQDTIMWVRFDLPPEDLPLFLAALGVTGELDPDSSDPTPHDAEWWEPETAVVRAGADYTAGIATSCRLLVDQSRSEPWRIYIACFNT